MEGFLTYSIQSSVELHAIPPFGWLYVNVDCSMFIAQQMEFSAWQIIIIVIYENKYPQSNYRSLLIYAFRVDVDVWRVNGKHFFQMGKSNLMCMQHA